MLMLAEDHSSSVTQLAARAAKLAASASKAAATVTTVNEDNAVIAAGAALPPKFNRGRRGLGGFLRGGPPARWLPAR